jgi:hypothetical protein
MFQRACLNVKCPKCGRGGLRENVFRCNCGYGFQRFPTLVLSQPSLPKRGRTKSFFVDYAISCLISAVILVTATVFAEKRLADLDILFLPGIIFAAIFYRQGIHSDHPWTYLAIAMIFNLFIYALPILFAVRLFKNRKSVVLRKD